MTPIEIIEKAIEQPTGDFDTWRLEAKAAVKALEEAGYRIVTDPPERPDWSEDKYGIELWFQNYKEWLERNGCPDAAQG